MLNVIMIWIRFTVLILGGQKQVALENHSVSEGWISSFLFLSPAVFSS
jgi:hypothetical protein